VKRSGFQSAEIGIKAPVLFVNLVLITIENIDVGSFIQSRHDHVKGMRSKEVIMVKKSGKFSSGQLEGGVGGSADMSIFIPEDDFYAVIADGILGKDSPALWFRGGIICDAKLPPGLKML
jgi:hypothetical protein